MIRLSSAGAAPLLSVPRGTGPTPAVILLAIYIAHSVARGIYLGARAPTGVERPHSIPGVPGVPGPLRDEPLEICRTSLVGNRGLHSRSQI